MWNVFWHRFRSESRRERLAALLLLFHLLGWLAARQSAAYALDLAAILRGEIWRLVVVPFLIPTVPMLLISSAILLGMVPSVVQRLGVVVFIVLCAGVIGMQSLTGLIALIATREQQLLYPVPPIVLFVLIAYAMLTNGWVSVGGYRLPRKWISLVWVLSIIISLFVANVETPALELVLTSQCCIAGAFALLGGAIARHRDIADQFRTMYQPVMMMENEDAAWTVSSEVHPHSTLYRNDAEYADALLEKIFQYGEASLTDEERAFLRRYSQQL